MTHDDIAQLFARTNEYRSIKYDLRNTELLLDRLGNPHRSFRSVLIAGTNGKGSVAAMLSAMMPTAGLYTSPHLQRLHERFRIGRNEISETDLTAVYAEVSEAARDTSRLLYPATYFEMTTAMAFVYFRGRTDFAILEVGMGGRLDATNVVRQDVSVITGIGLDHQEFLGSTLEEIAAEKAGIIKESEPVVIGPNADFEIIRRRAGERLHKTAQFPRQAKAIGQGYFSLYLSTPVRSYQDLRPALAGRHQLDNVAVAVRTAELLSLPLERIVAGVSQAAWPGRLERFSGRPTFLLDGAHNENGMQALSSLLAEFYPDGVSLIFGCMADKNYEAMLGLLRPHVRRATFTRVGGSRSKDPGELQKLWPGSRVASTVADAIGLARAETQGEQDTVLVCGTLYLIGEARSVLE
jgi:dihydrofolate synthase/folylpolyglutamate synthase